MQQHKASILTVFVILFFTFAISEQATALQVLNERGEAQVKSKQSPEKQKNTPGEQQEKASATEQELAVPSKASSEPKEELTGPELAEAEAEAEDNDGAFYFGPIFSFSDNARVSNIKLERENNSTIHFENYKPAYMKSFGLVFGGYPSKNALLPIRSELELKYRHGEKQTLKSNDFPGSTFTYYSRGFSFGFNLWLDLNLTKWLAPYAGAGIGCYLPMGHSSYSIPSTGGKAGTTSDTNSIYHSFYWQAGGGLRVKPIKNLAVDAGFRYVRSDTYHITHSEWDGEKEKVKFGATRIPEMTVSLQYVF